MDLNFEKMDNKLARANNPQFRKRKSFSKKTDEFTPKKEKDPYFLMAKKSLGQNFLKNKVVIKRIAEAGVIKNNELIIEIGPGTGELTEELLSYGASVIVIEKDQRAIPILQKRFENEVTSRKLTIIEGDFLEMDVKEVVLKDHAGKTFKIIANIPYYITGLIIRKSLELAIKPEKLIFLVQKEVAERIVKRDGKASILSQSIEAYGDAELLCVVSRGNFVPPPKVDSAVIVINNISDKKFKNTGISEEDFFGVIHAGFAHKRKKLAVNLIDAVLSINSEIPKDTVKEYIEDVFSKIGLDINTRAEEITNENWFQISSEIIHKFR